MKKLTLLFISCLLLFSCATSGKKAQGPGDLYVEGFNYMKQKKWDKAVVKFNEVIDNYPFDPLALVATVKLGDVHFERKDYVMAASTYENFFNAHPEDENAPYVVARLGECYEKLSLSFERDQANTLKAIERYTFLKNRYPTSNYAKVVDERLKQLEQKLADRELYVGEFYYRTGQYNASIWRLQYFLKKYPNVKGTDKALFYISMSYKELANPKESDRFTERLKTEYPKSVYAGSRIRERKTLRIAEADQTGNPQKSSRPGIGPAVYTSFVAEGSGQINSDALLSETALPPQPSMSFDPEPPSETRPPAATQSAPKTAGTVQTELNGSAPRTIKEAQKAFTRMAKVDALAGQATVQYMPIDKPREIALTPQMYADARQGPTLQDAGTEKGAVSEQGKGSDKGKKKDLDFFDKSKPIDIVSDTMEGFDKEKYVVFKGNVIAKQEDLYIFADTIEAYLSEDSNEITRALAKNNVKILKKDRTATSDEAIFDNKKGEIVLKGNVIVYQGQDKLSGDVITYYVNEDKAVVEADKGKRARVILTPR